MSIYDHLTAARNEHNKSNRSNDGSGTQRRAGATRDAVSAARRTVKQASLVPIALTIAIGWGSLAAIPKPIPKPKPAQLANYQHPKLEPDKCPEFSAEQAQKLLNIDSKPILSDVLHEPSKCDEIVNSDCVFSNPADHEHQVTYSRFRLLDKFKSSAQDSIVNATSLMKLEQKRKFGTPYSARYVGFGTRTTMDPDGHQSAWWLCGNHAITVALRTKQPNPTDQSTQLWKQLEPTIADKCGTPDSPAVIPATDDEIRIDEVQHAAWATDFDGPALPAVRTDGTYGPPIPPVVHKDNAPEYRYYRDYSDPCPWMSGTAGNLSGLRNMVWQSEQYYYIKVGGLGDRATRCYVSGTTKSTLPWRSSGPTDLSFLSLDFEAYTKPYNAPSTSTLENVARVHANPSTRAPYARKYHGFGVIHPDLVDGERRLEWLCRNHRLTIDFKIQAFERKISNDEIWEVSEAAINYLCKPANQPTKLAGDEQQYRIDYTKRLMQDWEIWSDQPRTTPPSTKRYVWKSILDSIYEQ